MSKPMNHPPARIALATFLAAAALAGGARAEDAQPFPVDLAKAQRYFTEARLRCEEDGGRLWGRSLWGPMMFVDPVSRALVANVNDPEGHLTPRGEVFTGSLPEDVGIANTATDWLGYRWTMLRWPMAESGVDRMRLMIHELFHHVQGDLGLPARDAVCAHLDSLDGRYWLQLEWRALSAALRAASEADTSARNGAIEDALLFRQARWEAIPSARPSEESLLMNEGLAEYTGVRLRGTNDGETMADLARRLPERAAHLPTYTRSFAYESGPAYGLLLDDAGADWRAGLGADDDLGDLLRTAIGGTTPDPALPAARKRAKVYGEDDLRRAEEERDRKHREELEAWRSLLVTGPVLDLPLSSAIRYSFNPYELVSLGDAGTVYPAMQVSDEWGEIQATHGALLSADRQHLYLAAPAKEQLSAGSGGKVSGPGWQLSLDPAWRIEPGSRPGDLRAVRR